MIKESISRLEYLCEFIPDLLHNIPEDYFSLKISPYTWSKKEILGHLIDSANNNHQRFVRARFENIPTISYAQNEWVESANYQTIDSSLLINTWHLYNRLLLEIVKRITAEDLKKMCHTNGDNHTIEWLIQDYISHMEHHLRQLEVLK